jgi:hypothetical protein
VSGNGSRKLTSAQLRQRREAPLRHGGYSADQIKRRARAHRRRFVRQAGLKLSGLDAVAGAYLDAWARALARVDLFDLEEREREPREYFAALNSARLSMGKLESRLRELGLDRRGDGRQGLKEYVTREYGGDS